MWKAHQNAPNAINNFNLQIWEFSVGLGIGAATFQDFCVSPGHLDPKDAFDHNNIIALMAGPLAETGIASAERTQDNLGGYAGAMGPA